MAPPKEIIIGEMAYPDPFIQVYEKTSVDSELVAGRVGSRGTADHQVKLYVAAARPLCVFIKQKSYPGLDSNGDRNTDYAQDTKPVEQRAFPIFRFRGNLKDGESVTKGGMLMGEATTGKLLAATSTNIPCAMAMETAAPSGADKEDFEALWIPGLPVLA